MKFIVLGCPRINRGEWLRVTFTHRYLPYKSRRPLTEKYNKITKIRQKILLAHVRVTNYIIKIHIFFRQTIDKPLWLLYYYRDHKVGAVGVLCPQAKNGGFFAVAYEAQFRSNKTNVR